MQWGNRRFVVLALVVAGFAVSLTGCAGSAVIPDTAAVSLGKQAIGFTGSDSANATSGWTSSATCPDSLKQGLLANVPAGAQLTELPALATTGILSDPAATLGDVPSCAFALTESGNAANEVLFIGMGTEYQKAIAAKLVSDGFVAGATTPVSQNGVTGTEQVYTKGAVRAGLEFESGEGITVFIVAG